MSLICFGAKQIFLKGNNVIAIQSHIQKSQINDDDDDDDLFVLF